MIVFLKEESSGERRALEANTPMSSQAMNDTGLPAENAKKAPTPKKRVAPGPTGKLSYLFSMILDVVVRKTNHEGYRSENCI